MACYSPLQGYKGEVNANGKSPVVWKLTASAEGVKQSVPCGKCIGCKLRYAKHWAMRCMHESQMHAANSFVTLTFDDDHLPVDGSLDVTHVQLFMKRLRKRYGAGIRYFFGGEYGAKLGRPHYHGLLFGHDFSDKVFKVERFGNRLYESQALAHLWPFGFHSVGDVSYSSASYVARYCLKKVNGESADEHYVDKRSGVMLKPEFTLMSRRPGIGATWYEKFKSDVFPSDEVVVNGKADKPPRYYDNLLDKEDPDLLESLKLVRASSVSWSESRLDRLMVKEEVKLSQVKSLVRSLGGE